MSPWTELRRAKESYWRKGGESKDTLYFKLTNSRLREFFSLFVCNVNCMNIICFSMNCCVPRKFQKLPGGLCISVRRLVHFGVSGFLWEEPPCDTFPTTRWCIEFLPDSGFWMKGLTRLVEPPGDADQIGLFPSFWVFYDDVSWRVSEGEYQQMISCGNS